MNRGSYLYHLPDSIPIKVAFMGLRRTWFFLYMNANEISTAGSERDSGRNLSGARADKCIKFSCNINILNNVALESDRKPGTQTEKHVRPGAATEHDTHYVEMNTADWMNRNQEKRRRKKGAVTGRTKTVLACKRKAGMMGCRKCPAQFRYLTLILIGKARKRKKEKLKKQYSSRKCAGRAANRVKYSNRRRMQEMITGPPFHRKKRRESATRQLQDFAAKNQADYHLSETTQTKSIYHESEGNYDLQVDCTVSHEDGNNILGTGKCYSSGNVHKSFREHGSDQFAFQPSCNFGLQKEEKARVHCLHHETIVNEDQYKNFRHPISQKVFCHAYVPQISHSRSSLEKECLSTETPSSSMSEMISVSGIIRRYFDSDAVSLTGNEAENTEFAERCPESHTIRNSHPRHQGQSCLELDSPDVPEGQSNKGGITPSQTEAAYHVEFYQSDQIRKSFLEQSRMKDAGNSKVRGKHNKGLSCNMLHDASLVLNLDASKSLRMNDSSRKKKRRKKERKENKEENRILHQQKLQVEGQMDEKDRAYQPPNGGDTTLEPAVGAASRAESLPFTSSNSGHSSPLIKPRRMEVGKRILQAVGSLRTSYKKKSSNLELSSMLSGSKSQPIKKLEFEIL